jgi:Tol biopolymer transport system component
MWSNESGFQTVLRSVHHPVESLTSEHEEKFPMTLKRPYLFLIAPLLSAGFGIQSAPAAPSRDVAAAQQEPSAEIFAPGVISGPANDGAPTFSPDGGTLYFTRSTANWSVILESHKVDGQWSKPTLAPFSGEWPDSSPGMSPDGSYIVFQSTRPATPLTVKPVEGQPVAGVVSNLWRVDRTGAGWSQPVRLPDAVNMGHSIWKPSIAANGNLYFTFIDDKGQKRLYSSKFESGAYQPAQPLAFSDGTTSDVDPEIAPDESFLVFCSSARLDGDQKDHLFIVAKQGTGWGKVVPIRYAGDDKYGFSTDDEPRLGQDHHTIYFSSDRAVPVHFPRTHEDAQRDVERLNEWDNSNSNVWYLPVDLFLNAAKGSS